MQILRESKGSRRARLRSSSARVFVMHPCVVVARMKCLCSLADPWSLAVPVGPTGRQSCLQVDPWLDVAKQHPSTQRWTCQVAGASKQAPLWNGMEPAPAPPGKQWGNMCVVWPAPGLCHPKSPGEGTRLDFVCSALGCVLEMRCVWTPCPEWPLTACRAANA